LDVKGHGVFSGRRGGGAHTGEKDQLFLSMVQGRRLGSNWTAPQTVQNWSPAGTPAIFVEVLVADPDAAVPAPVEVELCLSGGQRQGLFRLACLRNKDGVLLAAETAGENHLPASAAAQEPMGSMEGGGIRPGHGRSPPFGRPPIR